MERGQLGFIAFVIDIFIVNFIVIPYGLALAEGAVALHLHGATIATIVFIALLLPYPVYFLYFFRLRDGRSFGRRIVGMVPWKLP